MRVSGEGGRQQRGEGENERERENENTRWNDTGFHVVASKLISYCFCHILFMEMVTSSRGEKIISTP